MEKKLFYSFVAIITFFILHSYIGAKYFPKTSQENVVKSREQMGNGDIKKDFPKEEDINKEITLFKENEKSVELSQHTIGEFVVTYSSLGGYIKEISFNEQSNKLPFRNIGFSSSHKDIKFDTYVDSEKIVFSGVGGEKKEFIFKEYLLEIKIAPSISAPVVLFSNYLYPNMLDQRYQEVFYSQQNAVIRNGPKKIKESVLNGIDFAGARDRYYCISLTKGSYDVKWEKREKIVDTYLLSSPSHISLYIGPQTEEKLKPYGLQGVIYYGFFHVIGMGMTKVLYFFHFITKNWGISIVLFSVFIYLTLFPFTMKSTKAMKKMQQIQPEMEEMKKLYKDNPQKLQKETVALYRKYKINPLGGCLPLVFQLPIFFALYQVLFRFVELKGASFLWIKDLSLPDHFIKLPFPFLVKHINLLPLLIVGIGLFQQKITSSSAASEQKAMGLFFAVFLGVIFYNFPSALVLYWFVQNLFTLAYQVRIAKAPLL